MTKMLFIILVLSCVQLNAQETINFKDSLGRKQGHWIYFGKDRPEYEILPVGKVEEGNYVDDKKEGLWIKYHDDGKTPKLKGEYCNNRPCGKYMKFWSSGQLREFGAYRKNIQTDSLKRFFENGQLEYEAWFNEYGKEHGTVNFYYPNGQLELTYQANNGIPSDGKSYDINGKLLSEGHPGTVCFNGPYDKELPFYAPSDSIKPVLAVNPNKQTAKPVPPPKVSETPNTKGLSFKSDAYNKVYNADGEIWQDGIFKAGQLWDGKVYDYDQDGILIKVRVFKSGLYHSDGLL